MRIFAGQMPITNLILCYDNLIIAEQKEKTNGDPSQITTMNLRNEQTNKKLHSALYIAVHCYEIIISVRRITNELEQHALPPAQSTIRQQQMMAQAKKNFIIK